MGKKIKPKDFQKRREQSKTFKDWKDESYQFKLSVNPSFGVLTEKDKLYDKSHKKNTILDEEYVECESTMDVINTILGRKVNK